MNKVNLIGRLVKDADLKFTAGKGTAVATFTIAVDDGFGDSKKTYFIPVVVWGKSAESVAQYTQKGSKVGICGKITTRNYDNKDGQKVYVTEVVADMVGGVIFLDNKNNNASGNNNYNNSNMDFGTPMMGNDLPF